jgi:hypothetical protein
MKTLVGFAIGCVLGMLVMDIIKESNVEKEYQMQRRLHPISPEELRLMPPVFQEEDNPPLPEKPKEKGIWI